MYNLSHTWCSSLVGSMSALYASYPEMDPHVGHLFEIVVKDKSVASRKTSNVEGRELMLLRLF